MRVGGQEFWLPASRSLSGGYMDTFLEKVFDLTDGQVRPCFGHSSFGPSSLEIFDTPLICALGWD